MRRAGRAVAATWLSAWGVWRRSARGVLLVLLLATACRAEGARGAQPDPVEQSAWREIALPGRVTMSTGETLSGTVVGAGSESVVIDHPVLGRLSVPAAHARETLVRLPMSPFHPVVAGRLEPEGAGEPGGAGQPGAMPIEGGAAPMVSAGGASAVRVIASPAAGPPGAPPGGAGAWSGQVSSGVQGSEGNRSSMRVRAGFEVARKSREQEFDFRLSYALRTDEGELAENRLFSRARNSWLATDSPWEYFAESSATVDEFEDYDVRVTGGGGVAYRLFDDESLRLKGRLGAGVSREFGGSDNRWAPELIVGVEFSARLDDRNRVRAEAELYPSLLELGEIRTTERVAWEILVSPEHRLSLELGAEHRYDSNPQNASANNLDYFVNVLLKF